MNAFPAELTASSRPAGTLPRMNTSPDPPVESYPCPRCHGGRGTRIRVTVTGTHEIIVYRCDRCERTWEETVAGDAAEKPLS
jgi:hypothetical protein